MSEYEDLAVDGPMILGMGEKERWAQIIAPEPHYENIPSIQDPAKENRKLVMHVKLSNGSNVLYYPNRTSSDVIAKQIGTDMAQWIGKTIYWEVRKQKVAGNDKEVLYITSIK